MFRVGVCTWLLCRVDTEFAAAEPDGHDAPAALRAGFKLWSVYLSSCHFWFSESTGEARPFSAFATWHSSFFGLGFRLRV